MDAAQIDEHAAGARDLGVDGGIAVVRAVAEVTGERIERSLDGTWTVTIWAQEFFRSDPLGVELHERVASALGSVEGATSFTEHDNESWDAYGTPSGEVLTRAAANAVDDLADRMRQALGIA